MDQADFETTDIFRGAFLLCNGGKLDGIRFQDERKRIASFLIRGEGMADLDRTYRSGQALVNPLYLREALNHLRDVLFDTLRKNERRARHDRGRKGRHPETRYTPHSPY